jgi:hypothetical protein
MKVITEGVVRTKFDIYLFIVVAYKERRLEHEIYFFLNKHKKGLNTIAKIE